MDRDADGRWTLYVVDANVNFLRNCVVNSLIVELYLYVSPYSCNYTVDDVYVVTLRFRVSLSFLL